LSIRRATLRYTWLWHHSAIVRRAIAVQTDVFVCRSSSTDQVLLLQFDAYLSWFDDATATYLPSALSPCDDAIAFDYDVDGDLVSYARSFSQREFHVLQGSVA
jgi:hypothetical protein